MPGSVLDLNNAYDDTPGYDEPMFNTAPRRIGYDSPGYDTGRGTGTPRALPWRSTTAPPHLQLTNGSGDYEDDAVYGSNRPSPLALEPPARSPSAYRSPPPPPSYSRRSTSHDSPETNFSESRTAYEILRVGEYATPEEIKAAYKKQALRYHPDKCPENQRDEYTPKFQRITEAFAILGQATRRAEYDKLRKERNNASRSPAYRSSTPARTPTFKSSFMPEKPVTRSFRAALEHDRRQDLRVLSPFKMFDRMFPDLAAGFGGSGHRSPDMDERLSSISGFKNAPPIEALQSSIRPGQSRRMQERYERAKLDKHGNLQVSQGQRSIKVHKSGGFTFESRSFSASSSGGDMNMLQAMMASMNGMGSSFSGGGGGSSSGGGGIGMFGSSDMGFGDAKDAFSPPPSSSRGRRQSFGAIEDAYGPSSRDSGFSSSRALQRRPSMSFEDPLAIESGLSDYGGLDLTPYRGSDRSLSRSRY